MHKFFFVLLMHLCTTLKSGPFKQALSYGHLKRFSAFDFAFDVVESHDLNSYEHEVLACLGENIRRVEFVQGSCVGVLKGDRPVKNSKSVKDDTNHPRKLRVLYKRPGRDRNSKILQLAF